MIGLVEYDISSVRHAFADLEHKLQNKIIKAGADAGGKVLLNAYRNSLEEHHKDGRLPGTYKSASGAVQYFIAAYQAVGQRTLLFKDRNGAYSVVGILAAPGNWRPQAPQGTFIEGGTVERKNSLDQNRGSVEALHLLAKVAAEYGQAAQDKCIQVITAELAQINVNP